MGVQGLWKLLESTGRPVSLESLEGKVLAVDVSLWLHQAMRGMRDDRGNVAANAHLHVLFNRICKLLFFRIKPIFVFDGSVPELKRQTMVARRQRREIAAGKSKSTSEKIIKTYLQSHALHAVMGGAGGSQEETAPRLKRVTSAEPDLYELPPVPPTVLQESDSDSDDELDPSADHLSHYQNLSDVDIDSENFKALPPEIQHEMIVEMKETRKSNSWKTIDQLPKKSTDFSDYQVKKLLQKGKMTKRIDVLRKEMSERTAGAITSMLDLESGRTHAVQAGRIMAEDSHHYILIKRQSSKAVEGENKDTIEEDVDTQDNDADLETLLPNPNINDGSDLKVKGHISDDVTGQGSSQMPWESDVIVIDDAEDDTDSNHAAEIAQIVRHFFHVKTSSTGSESHERGTFGARAADVKEVIVLDHEDLVGQRSESEVEIIQAGTENRENIGSFEKSKEEALGNEEVIILDDDNQKDVRSLRRVGIGEQAKRGLICDKMPSTSRAEQSLRIEADSTGGKMKEKVQSEQSGDIELINKDLAKDSLLAPSPDVISLDADEDDDYTALVNRGLVIQKGSAMAKRGGGRAEGADGGVIEVSEESSDDGDFVEVIDQPVSLGREEELFPPSTFIPSVDAGKIATLASSPSKTKDIHPQDAYDEPRIDHGSFEMDENALVTESDNLEKTHDDGEDDEISDADNDEEEGEEDDEMESHRSAAREEWQAMNVDDVPHLQKNLEAQRQVLQMERGRQDRVAASITDIMYAESKELLELFGVPYVVSPEEAEAQCAFLDETDQTQGTITDDSDVWLFGGRNIYRNVFSKGKDVECFKSTDVEKHLVLDRCKLITLAMLLGSDYTEGVKGIGWVTAMEVLTEFPGIGIDLLQALKSWWDVAHKQLMPPVESQLKGKLRNVTLPSSFPCQHVFDAYLSPVVDESREEFSWQSPDLGLLRDFAKDKLGWTRTKADEALLPVMKKLNENVTQSKITSFLHVEREEPRKVTSKRLKRVLKHLRNPLSAEQDEEEKQKGWRKGGGRRMNKKEVSKEMKDKRRKTGGIGNNEEDLRDDLKNIDAQRDAVSLETGEDADEGCEVMGRRSNHRGRTKEDAEDDSEEVEGFTVSKKIKMQIDSGDSPFSSLRRSRRTNQKKDDICKDEQLPLAEFLEIEEAMSRKTEGMISKTLHLQTVQTENLKSSEIGTTATTQATESSSDAAGQVEMKNQLIGLKQGQVKQGQSVKGQRGKGKGHAGLKGKGKAAHFKGRRREGPKLSESSSSD